MSGTNTTDLKAAVVKLAGDIDVAAARATKADLEKTAKALAPLKAEMLKGMKLDFKPETLEVYRTRLETIAKVEEAETKQKQAELKKATKGYDDLIGNIEARMKEAETAKLDSSAKRLAQMKKDLIKAANGEPTADVVELYEKELIGAEKALAKELEKSSGKGKEEAPEKWTVSDSKAEWNEIQSAHKTKYKQFVDLIKKGNHPKDAAEEIGDSHYESVTGGYTIRLSKEHRVHFTISGNSVTVKQVGGHYPKTKK